MAAKAAKAALERAGISASELDLILIGTVTPDHPLPSAAAIVQQKIGATCPSMDVVAACAGFLYGLSVADAYVRAGLAKNVLVVGVELLSRILNWSDRNTCVLFGDGAGAAVVSRSDGTSPEILSTHIFADGSLAESLWIPAGGTAEPITEEGLKACRNKVHMTGQNIFKFAVKGLSDASLTALKANGLTTADVSWVVPHQANTRILEAVASRTGVPMERFYLNIEKYGNTSSASVPIALDEAARSGTLKRGDNVLLCALGAGVTWGSALVRW